MKKLMLLAMFLPVVLFGQIIIDHTELPQETGVWWITNNTDSTTVDLGTIGGPQVWDFIGQAMGNDSTFSIIIDIASVPCIDSFPGVNLVTKDIMPDTSYYYRRLVSDSINGLGVVVKDSAQGELCFVFRPFSYTPLPLSYNESWRDSFVYHFKVEIFDVYNEYRAHCKVDAYGTVKIPYGKFECLRVCVYDTIRQWIPGIMDTTLTHIGYSFITENYGTIVSVRSYEGETNPNFTEAEGLNRMTHFSFIGIEDADVCKEEKVRHFPNPCYEIVDIRYIISQPGNVSLKIYNVSGELVRDLVNGISQTGKYNVRWDGKNERGERVSPGIYFYRLQNEKESIRRKIVLLK